jgi:hypothetical protein
MLEGKKLQWTKGDKIGKVETVQSIDEEGWLTFDGGGRISSDLVGEFMLDASEGALEIEDMSYRSQFNPNATQAQTQHIQTQQKESPLMSLLKKMTKADPTSLNVTVEVGVPSSAVYNILIDSFGEEEVHTEITNYILNQVDDQLIKESVVSSVYNIIQNLK